jgi:hypothetical protein
MCLLSIAVACGDSGGTGGGGHGGGVSCDVTRNTGCAQGKVCEEVSGGKPACFDPVTLKGKVFDLVSEAAIGGARVVARDENGSALSDVAISAADGSYSLAVPAARDASGRPVSRSFTLRADASGYQSFPAPPRVALPLDLADATGTPPVLQKPNSDIGLVALTSTAGLGTVSGDVVVDLPGGTLVDASGHTGVADRAGHFVVFNVPAGAATLTAYKKGTNFDPATASVSAGAETQGVKISANARAAVKVSGSVQIVDPMGAMSTSVILVLEDTFDATLARGETPPGLRAANVTGAFSIDGVPDGKYAVLAAFENDGLVRDPDTSIAGTQIVHITVSGADQAISQGFKVTGALAVVSPGANGVDTVSGTPVFTWQKDTSNTGYHVQVFDTFGTLVWETTGPFDQGGNKPATVTYAGPALASGMLYQFRATSLKNTTPLSSTEDLKGVFAFK